MYEIVYTNRMKTHRLLMYQIFENELILSATATGSLSVYCNEVLDIIDSYIDIKEAAC